MNCKNIATLVDRYAHQELDEETRRAVDAHLDGCDACRAELAGVTRIGAVLRAAVEPAEPPAGLAEHSARAAFVAGRRPRARPSLLDRLLPVAWPTALASAATAALLWFAVPAASAKSPTWGGTIEAASLGLGASGGETAELTVATELMAATLGDQDWQEVK